MATVLTAMLVYPIFHYLGHCWNIKREDIFSSFRPASMEAYLVTFLRKAKLPNHKQNKKKRRSRLYMRLFGNDSRAEADPRLLEFDALYQARYGRWRFFIPVLLLLCVSFPLMLALSQSALLDLKILIAPPKYGYIPFVSLSAVEASGIIGAYLWVVAEFIAAIRQYNLAPGDVLRTALRLTISAPLGIAIGSVAGGSLPAGAFVAFAVGAFPLDIVGVLLRQLANRFLKLNLPDGGQPEQILKLEGVDSATANHLRDAGVTTIAELAYYDPVQLCMRTGLVFDYLLDIVSQALAWIYFGEKMNDMRQYGLRGAIEIQNLNDLVTSKNADEQKGGKAIFAALTDAVKIDGALLGNAFDEIANDPYTAFLTRVWQDTR